MTSSTSAIELSEKHYALGALLLIPCLISFYRKREFKFLKIVFSQVFVLVFVILAYSLELPSFNSLFDFIPIFGLFRIPFRDFLPLALLIPALLLARSEYSFNVLLLRVNWMNFCIAILAVYLCSAFLPIPVELLLVTLLIFDQVLRRQSSYAKFSQDIGLALIVSLVFVSFSCFKQNMTLFTPAADLRVLSENQGIASLARVELTRMHPVWRALSARASGRSSLDGYWLPPKSLAESITWANSQVDTSAATLQNPFQNAYHFNQNDKAFPLLSKLYNIEGQFSGYELSTNSLKTMTRFNLAENGKLLSADSSSPCKDLKGKVTITEQGFPEMLSFEFKSPAQCEVVLPINFYPQFEISKPNSSVTLTKGLGGMSLLRLPAGASSGKVEFSSWSNPLRALFLGEILFFLSFLINRYRKKEGSH